MWYAQIICSVIYTGTYGSFYNVTTSVRAVLLFWIMLNLEILDTSLNGHHHDYSFPFLNLLILFMQWNGQWLESKGSKQNTGIKISLFEIWNCLVFIGEFSKTFKNLCWFCHYMSCIYFLTDCSIDYKQLIYNNLHWINTNLIVVQ